MKLMHKYKIMFLLSILCMIFIVVGCSKNDTMIIDNKEVKNMSDLTKSLYTYKTGDKAKIKIYKDGVEREVEVQF